MAALYYILAAERVGMASVSRLAVLLLGAHAAWAQYIVSARAGTIHDIRGQVTVDGQPLSMTHSRFPVLQEGQVLRTANGRAEVLLGPGVFLRLGDQGAIVMLSNRLEDTQVKLQQGTALVEVVEMPKGSDVHVVVGSTRTAFKGIGLHRFEVDSKEVCVFGGHAEVVAGAQKVEARRGKAVHLESSLSVSSFDVTRKDALHRWAARRSFLLFRSNLESRSRQTNWEVRVVNPANTRVAVPSDRNITYLSNRDFGVIFPWQIWAQAHSGSKPQGPGN
jgi:hypothetical protein